MCRSIRHRDLRRRHAQQSEEDLLHPVMCNPERLFCTLSTHACSTVVDTPMTTELASLQALDSSQSTLQMQHSCSKANNKPHESHCLNPKP